MSKIQPTSMKVVRKPEYPCIIDREKSAKDCRVAMHAVQATMVGCKLKTFGRVQK